MDGDEMSVYKSVYKAMATVKDKAMAASISKYRNDMVGGLDAGRPTKHLARQTIIARPPGFPPVRLQHE